MKFLIKIGLPIGTLSALTWWFIAGAIPEAIVRPAGRGTVRDGVPGNVVVLADRTYNIVSGGTGLIIETAMKPYGKSVAVEKNATLVKMDSYELVVNLEQVQYQLDFHEKRIAAGSVTAMRLKTMRREFESLQALADQDKFPLAELQKHEDAVHQLETQLEQEKLTLRQQLEDLRVSEGRLQRQISGMTLPSPMDGVLTNLVIAPGDMVFAGTHLGQVVSHERLVEVTLNEEDFAGAAEGQEVAVTLLSMGSEIFEGNVTRLSATVDPASGRRKLYVELEGGNERFTPGSSGRAEIIKSVRTNALLVPRKALMGSAVFVVTNGIAEARDVKVGARNLLTAEILDGLEKGEQVIVETPHLFRDGQKVKPVPVGGK
jgi:multidrug efflux pump subunit AcrA (membrane-fusion protein)